MKKNRFSFRLLSDYLNINKSIKITTFLLAKKPLTEKKVKK